MINAQVWLNSNYSSKTENKIEGTQKSLEKELKISNFPNLEKIILSQNKITKLTVENCPKVKEINVYNNEIVKLEIESLTQLENLEGIEKLVDLEGLRGKGIIKKLREEIKIHLEAMERTGKLYRQNPPSEETTLVNILQAISNDYLTISRENKQKEQEIKELKEIINSLENLVIRTKDSFLVEKIESKHNHLEQLKINIINNLNGNWHETLDDLLEAQKAFIQSDSDFVRNQITRFKQRLLNSGQINQPELKELCQVQTELSFLEMKLKQEGKFQVQIEVSQNI